MIPSSITTGVSSLNAALAAMGSFLSASITIRRALLQQAASLVTAIDAAEKTAAGALDTFQGSVMPGDTVRGVLALLTSAQDEQTLSDLRGVIGRMVLNIEVTGGTGQSPFLPTITQLASSNAAFLETESGSDILLESGGRLRLE